MYEPMRVWDFHLIKHINPSMYLDAGGDRENGLQRFEIPEMALWRGLERLTQWRRPQRLMMQRKNYWR